MARPPRLRRGTPRNTSTASAAPLIGVQPRPWFALGRASVAVVGGVVVTVIVAVPDVVPALSVMGEPLVTVQEGRSVAPCGEVVSAQLRLTVPA